MHTRSIERAKEQSPEGGVIDAEPLEKRVPDTPKVFTTPKARAMLDIQSHRYEDRPKSGINFIRNHSAIPRKILSLENPNQNLKKKLLIKSYQNRKKSNIYDMVLVIFS